MAKAKVIYQCTACGGQSNKWAGQCPDCNAWNTLEESVATPAPANPKAAARHAGYAGQASKIERLADVAVSSTTRLPTGNTELDRVLGGGLVPGSVTLIGGDPGVGKSTLLVQVLAAMTTDTGSLYVTGEESLQQVKLRAERLSLQADNMQLLAETGVERIVSIGREKHFPIMVIDSIQTIYSDQLQAAPGSVSQVRESAAQLVRFAKQTGVALLIVGHVTKDGQLAGPRVLEHMVDTVLYFEGEAGSRLRMIRSVKNRFGAVNELGVFAMEERGLIAVSNPSAIFLSRHEEPVSGSVIMATMEGTRPLLVEIQALVEDSQLGNPRRLAVGVDSARLNLLLAVLHRHGGIAMGDQDVYVNAVGGVRVSETAADLPTILACLSSLRDRPSAQDLIAFGEVGLAGEVRPVPNGQDRLRTAAKQGFKRAIVPKRNIPKPLPKGIEVIGVSRLVEAVEHFI
ncbi:MAG: DNA repair protein RadA [Granulosicoccaceae bacterium]